MRTMVSSVLLLVTLISVTSGCGTGDDSGLKIPGVTAPSSGDSASSAPTAASSLPRRTSPACRLLGDEDIRRVLGQKVQPAGDKSPYYGAAKIPLYVDLCSWQKGSGSSVQLQVETAASERDAIAEYKALVQLTREHTAPTGSLQPISGLGARAVLLPSWLIAQYSREVIAVTYSAGAGHIADPQELRQLAEVAAGRLHWK